jgi:integrase
MRTKILLPNGCSCSTPSVNPKNWKSCNKSALKKDWYISYRFYDPEFDKPKQVTIQGMNMYREVSERRCSTQIILDDELHSLKVLGFNPITKKYLVKQQKPLGTMHSDLLIVDAFRLALTKLKGTDEYLKQIHYALNRFEIAVKKLRMTEITIYKFRRSELKEIFDYLNLTDNYFNKVKAYFSTLFKQLIEYECCENNITRDIQKRKITKNQREVLDYKTLNLVLDYLKPTFPEFYRYGKVFLFSGARSTELLSVQRKHVRLEKQEYDVLIKKREQYVWETKIIIQNAIPFWTEIVQQCKSKDDFLFSHGLVPGPEKNVSKQITIRWRLHVKQKLVIKDGTIRLKKELDKENDFDYESITADFYAGKHTFLDLLDSINDTEINTAKEIASHQSDKITHGVYTTGRTKRKNEILKQISV